MAGGVVSEGAKDCAQLCVDVHEKLELSLSGRFFVTAIPVWLHTVMIPVNFMENDTDVGLCPWVGLPCWRRRALLVPPLLPVYILMQGFTFSCCRPLKCQRRLLMLLPIFFDPEIRKIYQLQVRIIQAIQASIIYMGNGNFPNCLPPARVGHYCMHCWGFKTGLKWGELFLAPKSTYYMQDHVYSSYRRCESHFNRVSEGKCLRVQRCRELHNARLCSSATN